MPTSERPEHRASRAGGGPGGDLPRSVHTLVGQSTLEVSLACLPSLARYSADEIRVVIHEDGSLTESSRARLRAALPDVEFIDRVRADAEVGERLRHHPLCRLARASNVMFLKMFDVALLEPGELVYCDSDILFLRPFSRLFGPPDARFRMLFMTDVKNAYAVRPWHLWPLGPLRLVSRANAGLMRIAAGALDLDFVEWVLRRMGGLSVWTRRPYWNEQTCWAALAGRGSCGLWDAGQIAMATRDMAGCSPHAVAIHFISTHRHHLATYAARALPPTSAAVSVVARPAPRVTPLGQVLSDLRARAERGYAGTRARAAGVSGA